MEIRHDSYEQYIEKLVEENHSPCVLFYNNERTKYNKSRRANWHENLEIQLCHSGEGYVLINGEKYNIRENDIIVANSNVVHYNGTDTAINYSALIIDTDFCKGAGIDHTKISFETLIKSEKLTRLYGEVIKAYYTDDKLCKTARLQAALLSLLIELREKHTDFEWNELKTNKSFEQVKSTIRFIRENFAEKLTLDMIAKNALADKYRLSRRFKDLTGQTIVQYVNNYRCERAKELIGQGIPVSEAAVRCGFNNMSFFTKTFKEFTGKLPSDYKK